MRSAGRPGQTLAITYVSKLGDPASSARLLAPVQPLVVLGMAHNGAPGDRELPRQAFLKSPGTVRCPGESIMLDDDLGRINIECELAVVIRRHCRHLTEDQVADAILGYTVGNDVTAFDQIPLDEKMTQSKNGDGFTPLGRWIETSLDPSAVAMSVRVNGEVMAEASTAQLAWNITEQLVYLTRYLPLGPGDVILTGAPRTFAPVKPGDHSEVSLAGIGSLGNPYAAAELPTGATLARSSARPPPTTCGPPATCRYECLARALSP